jgi:hypothetical protein
MEKFWIELTSENSWFPAAGGDVVKEFILKLL